MARTYTANDVFIHIGLLKTGSTFLQRHVIPQLGVYDVAGQLRTDSAETPFGILSPFLRRFFSAEEAALAQEQLARFFENISREIESHGGKAVWSWEGLSGSPLLGFLNQVAIADLLRQTFPKAKILVTLRRQSDFVESTYVQTIHQYHWGKPANFLFRDDNNEFSPYEFAGSRINPRLSVLDLDWEALVEVYQVRFGKKNVLALPYELLAEDCGSFIAEWCHFIGCVEPDNVVMKWENRSYSKLSFRIARFLNRFIRTKDSPCGFIVNRPFCAWLLPRIGHSRLARFLYGVFRRIDLRRILQEYVDRLFYTPSQPFSNELKQRIMSVHAAGNKSLDQKIGGGLEKYGYY